LTKPFFKWPGSKAWLAGDLANILPTGLKRVVEPFAGSASFYLGTSYTRAFLADTNEHVVRCLRTVRDEPEEVLRYLGKLQNCLADYLVVRDQIPANDAAAAGRLIFLTNTSWGGLYRENLRGQFNVPFGRNGRSFFCREVLLEASNKLKGVEVQRLPFSQTLQVVKKDDLLFVDAPYVTERNAQYFDRYLASRFEWSDQVALARLLGSKKLRSKKILVTCAADKDLYRLFCDWSILVYRKRNSMTAHTKRAGYRSEALLVSPALREMSAHFQDLERVILTSYGDMRASPLSAI